MKRFLLSALGLVALCTTAVAQVNVVPQTGVNTANLRVATYSAVSIALVPAASATDIFCIAASSTKTIEINRLSISGTAGTLVSAPFTLVKRASLDTGGTGASTTANPANTTTKHVSTNAAASATLIAYTANPTIVDTSPGYIRTDYLTLPTTAAGTVIVPLLWEFGTAVDAYNQPPTLVRGSTQQYCVNLNAVSVSSGVLQVSIEWTEK